MAESHTDFVEHHSLRSIRAAFLRYYRRHCRDLPWRRTHDPYAIWISEVMLQQTQVDTVVPRYEAFLREFPTVQKLAEATESHVCEAWAGLGYYRRARNLHAAARVVAKEHAGQLPTTARELQRLPGIGQYTAGAIASIAFGEAAPAVDGNVVRVFARLFAIDGPPESASIKRSFAQVARALSQGPAPGDLNQAIMELGATICTPARPACERCPVRRWCVAEQRGEQERFPAASKKAPRSSMQVCFAWLDEPRGVWLRQRPLEGLWAGLWEPPSEIGRGARDRLASQLGLRLEGRAAATVRHDLTHRRVTARAYRGFGASSLQQGEQMRPFLDPLAAPLSALARKVVHALMRRV